MGKVCFGMSYFMQTILSIDDIQKADLLLLDFCKSFEKVFGPQHVTCNMHLHNHLKDCLLDFGPIHGFWCFSFEIWICSHKQSDLTDLQRYDSCEKL